MPDWAGAREWIAGSGALVGGAGIAVSLLLAVGSVVLVAFFIARMPADYFARLDPPPSQLGHRHPVMHVLLHLLRNVAGVLLVIAGVAMLVLPGQGLLTILLGLILLEFPGKRRIEFALVRRPKILSGLNWLRAKLHREPFVVYEER